MKIYCWFKNKDCMEDASDFFWERDIEFPFPPFPGLYVGSFKVKAVFVCQGSFDGGVFAQVQFCGKSLSHDFAKSLIKNGWKCSPGSHHRPKGK